MKGQAETSEMIDVVEVTYRRRPGRAAEGRKHVHNDGSQSFDDYNQVRNAALKWLEPRGFVAERQVIGRFGAIAGKPIGMSTADGRVGFRVEFDSRSGAHINVWDYNAAKGMQKGDHYTFKGSRKTMNRIARQFGCR